MRANVITFIAAVFGAFILLRQAMGLPWTSNRVIGVAIAVPALLLVLTARVQLGRAFSVQARATNLVTSGLYSRVRNPIYVFSTIGVLGVIIWSGQPVYLLLLALLVAVQILRSRKESAVLEEKFGDEYREYKRKTWF